MSRLILRHFKADGLEIILNLGFIPDLVRVWLDEGTYPDMLTWYRRMVDDETIYGYYLQGSDGVVTRKSSAASGIIAYDTTQQGVLIDSPVGGKVFASVTDWATGTSYSTGQRTATAIGTIIRPPTHNGFVYELTTDQANGTGEPSIWPTVPGETVADDGANIWTCRVEEIIDVGAKGIVIGANADQNTDNNQVYVEAWKADRDPADLDVATVSAGIPA